MLKSCRDPIFMGIYYLASSVAARVMPTNRGSLIPVDWSRFAGAQSLRTCFHHHQFHDRY